MEIDKLRELCKELQKQQEAHGKVAREVSHDLDRMNSRMTKREDKRREALDDMEEMQAGLAEETKALHKRLSHMERDLEKMRVARDRQEAVTKKLGKDSDGFQRPFHPLQDARSERSTGRKSSSSSSTAAPSESLSGRLSACEVQLGAVDGLKEVSTELIVKIDALQSRVDACEKPMASLEDLQEALDSRLAACERKVAGFSSSGGKVRRSPSTEGGLEKLVEDRVKETSTKIDKVVRRLSFCEEHLAPLPDLKQAQTAQTERLEHLEALVKEAVEGLQKVDAYGEWIARLEEAMKEALDKQVEELLVHGEDIVQLRKLASDGGEQADKLRGIVAEDRDALRAQLRAAETRLAQLEASQRPAGANAHFDPPPRKAGSKEVLHTPRSIKQDTSAVGRSGGGDDGNRRHSDLGQPASAPREESGEEAAGLAAAEERARRSSLWLDAERPTKEQIERWRAEAVRRSAASASRTPRQSLTPPQQSSVSPPPHRQPEEPRPARPPAPSAAANPTPARISVNTHARQQGPGAFTEPGVSPRLDPGFGIHEGYYSRDEIQHWRREAQRRAEARARSQRPQGPAG